MSPAPLLLRGATVITTPDAVPAPNTDILVVDGRIAAIGAGLDAPADVRVIEVGGRWIVPGLVDAHVHIMNVPGSPWLPPDALPDLRRRALGSYVAAGVTTVLDLGILPDRLAELRSAVADGAAAPRMLVVGGILGPTGGYPGLLEPAFGGVASAEEVQAALDRNAALGAVAVKVTFERGFGGEDWPLFDAAARAAIREAAEARHLPVLVHAMTPSEFLPALDLAPRAFVHAPERPDRDVTGAIARSGAHVVTTLTLYDAALAPRTRRLDDPLLRAIVPAELAAAADDRATTVAARRALGEMNVPWVPGWAAGMGAGARAVGRQRLRRALAAVRDLHAAGVPLVLGTDSGTWPLLHAQFPGWAAIRELELLGDAGLSPAEALAAGTTNAARMLGLEEELGAVRVGRAADLVVLGADPLADAGAWRTIELVVHDGLARTPGEWAAP
jgi:imidazolonepropionase-like amidohydrolase